MPVHVRSGIVVCCVHIQRSVTIGFKSISVVSKEKWDRMMRTNSWNSVELRDNRYNQIVHMVSAANGAEAFYSTEDHACRSEGVDLARELDYKSAAAWIGHPYFDVIDNSTDFESKVNRMIECVCQKLGIDTGDRLLTTSKKVKFLGNFHTISRDFQVLVMLLFVSSVGTTTEFRLPSVPRLRRCPSLSTVSRAESTSQASKTWSKWPLQLHPYDSSATSSWPIDRSEDTTYTSRLLEHAHTA